MVIDLDLRGKLGVMVRYLETDMLGMQYVYHLSRVGPRSVVCAGWQSGDEGGLRKHPRITLTLKQLQMISHKYAAGKPESDLVDTGKRTILSLRTGVCSPCTISRG